MRHKGPEDNHSLRAIRNVPVRRALSITKMLNGASPLQVKVNDKSDVTALSLLISMRIMGPRVLEAR